MECKDGFNTWRNTGLQIGTTSKHGFATHDAPKNNKSSAYVRSNTYSHNPMRYDSKQKHLSSKDYRGDVGLPKNEQAQILRDTEFHNTLANKHGAPLPISNTSGDVICVVCHEPIRGLIVQALNQTWHQEHFICYHCQKPINGQRFNINEGKPFCEEDYAFLFLKKCAGCSLPIKDVVVKALDTFWHRDHFVCTACGTKLANKGFFEREKNPFCQQCYEQKFCPRCKECDQPVTDTVVIALGENWHQSCFKCKHCVQPVTDSTFQVMHNKPICAKCVSLVTK